MYCLHVIQHCACFHVHRVFWQLSVWTCSLASQWGPYKSCHKNDTRSPRYCTWKKPGGWSSPCSYLLKDFSPWTPRTVVQLKLKKIPFPYRNRNCAFSIYHVVKSNFSQCSLYGESCGFSGSHAPMWELDHKKGRTLKNWCFQIMVLEKTAESSLDLKERKKSTLKEINPNIHWKDWWWSWSSNI